MCAFHDYCSQIQKENFLKKILLSLLDRYQLSNTGNYFAVSIIFCWVVHCLGTEKAILLNSVVEDNWS